MEKIISLYLGSLFFLSLGLSFGPQVAAQEIRVDHSRMRLGVDHAPESVRHDQSAKNFIDRHFKDQNHEYSLIKIGTLLERLQREKAALKKDLYETEILEGIKLHLYSYKKAYRKAIKESDETRSEILKGYTEYLIPKIEQLYQLVKEEKHPEMWDGLTDDFIRGYNPYFIPNALRTIWNFDDNVPAIAKHALIPYSFERNDPKKVEANNLIVEEHNREEIAKCLKKEIAVGKYLTEDELQILKDCSYDLSKINPGVSPFWRQLSSGERAKIRDPRDELYPIPGSEVSFDNIIYRGAGSAKMHVGFEKMVNGSKEKKIIKLKMGDEVHTDIATSLLGEFAGFNHDKMQYVSDVKVNLGKTSYEQFKTLLERKYGIDSVVRFPHSHDGQPGNEWVIIKDALFEGRPPEEARIGGLDIASWDLQNRREYRGYLLWAAWLNIGDVKPENFKVLFQKTENGKVPLHRLQDAGYSLGAGLFVVRKDPTKFGTKYKINDFETNIVSSNKKKDQVKVWWNDFHNRDRFFSNTTWNDLKWMARQIAQISDDEIFWSLKQSGIDEEIIPLYRHKLVLRRNEILKAFGLEHEYPLYEVPNLKEYSPNDAIKKGEVVKTAFAGKTDMVINPQNFFLFLAGLGGQEIPLHKHEKKFHDGKEQITAKFNHALTGLTTLREDFNLNRAGYDSSVMKVDLGIGINVVLSRKVSGNPQLLSSQGKGRPYMVTDVMALEIGVSSGILDKANNLPIPLKASGGIKLFRKEFVHIHHAENMKDAYLSGFKLPLIIMNRLSYALKNFAPLETFKSSTQYGIDFKAGLGLDLYHVIKNELSGTIGWVKGGPSYYYKDQFGALHYYHEKSQKRFYGGDFSLGKLNAYITGIPFISLNKGKMHFNYLEQDVSNKTNGIESRDFSPDDFSEKKVDDKYAFRQFLSDRKMQDHFDVRKKILPKELNLNYQIKSEGTVKNSSRALFFLWKKSRHKSQVKTDYTLKNGDQRFFAKYEKSKRRSVGLEELNLIGQKNMLTHDFNDSSVIIEVDRDNPRDFVGLIKAQEFYRTRTKKELVEMIDKLNSKFSQNSETPFYRDYELPPADEVDLYRKIYAQTDIYIRGKTFLKKIQEMSEQKMREILQATLEDSIVQKSNSCWPGKVDKKMEKTVRVKQLFSLFKDLKRELENQEEVKDDGKAPKMDKVHQLSHQFFSKLFVEKYGVALLEEILGPKNMFVMGEILGVNRSFSTLQDLQWEARRRFTGRSWGTLKKLPPIQFFIRNDRPVPYSLYLTPEINPSMTTGELPTGMPENED